MKHSSLLKTVTLPAEKSKELGIYTTIINEIPYYNGIELLDEYFSKYLLTNNQILDRVDNYDNTKFFNVRVINVEDSNNNITSIKYSIYGCSYINPQEYEEAVAKMKNFIQENQNLKWYEIYKKWQLKRKKKDLLILESHYKIETIYNTYHREYWLDVYTYE